VTGAEAAAPDLEPLLRANPVVAAVCDRLPQLGLPDWYLGAGAVAQTVWNWRHGYAPDHGIRDYDVVYFDDRDLGPAAEEAARRRVAAAVADLHAAVDVTNEARVHLWYERRFGVPLAPYRSTEEAIATWPTTATAVGVRPRSGGGLDVCAPFGLADLLAMVVRPNRVLVTEAVYRAKADRWRRAWPRLTVLSWDDGVAAG
jgi:uncharacterized protein